MEPLRQENIDEINSRLQKIADMSHSLTTSTAPLEHDVQLAQMLEEERSMLIGYMVGTMINAGYKVVIP